MSQVYTIEKSNSELHKQIISLRAQLIESGMKNGFQSLHTLQLSQELDKIIFEYQLKLIR